jgi:serine/threonine-protein kinase
MTPEQQLQQGTDVNGWRLTELLASPGPYQVWRGINLLTRQLADVKVYNPKAMPQTMVLREVDLLMQMRLPQFPCLLSHFPWGDSYVVATKTVDGCTLEELLANNPGGLPLELAENAARSLLTGLFQLHQLPGTPIHRAISPAHILLDMGMKLFISGLAFAEPSDNLAMSETLPFHFEDPRYQAPEVFGDPAAASPQSNVYSAACVLFEIFTGRRAFDSDERNADAWFADLAYQHLNVPPPMVSNHAPWLPEYIGAAIDLALSKEPEQRPAGCLSFAEMLSGMAISQAEPAAEEVELEVPPPPRRGGFWNWFRAKDPVA